MTTKRTTVQRIWDALGTLPTVQVGVVTTTVLWLVTFAWAVGLSVFRQNSTDAVPVFNAWLYALCAKTGIVGATFVGKRATFDPHAPDGGSVPLPAPAAVIANTAVVAPPPASGVS